jgi:hypothetical protein
VDAIRAFDERLLFAVSYDETKAASDALSRFLGTDVSDAIARSYRPTRDRHGNALRMRKSGLEQHPAWRRLTECVRNLSSLHSQSALGRLAVTLDI